MLPPSGCADFRVGSFSAAWQLSGPRAAAVASTRSYTRLGLLVRALGAVHAFELNPAGVERLVRGERRPIGFSLSPPQRLLVRLGGGAELDALALAPRCEPRLPATPGLTSHDLHCSLRRSLHISAPISRSVEFQLVRYPLAAGAVAAVAPLATATVSLAAISADLPSATMHLLRPVPAGSSTASSAATTFSFSRTAPDDGSPSSDPAAQQSVGVLTFSITATNPDEDGQKNGRLCTPEGSL